MYKKTYRLFRCNSEKVSINVTWLKKKKNYIHFNLHQFQLLAFDYFSKKNGFLLDVEYTGDVISLLFALFSSFFCPFIAYCFKSAGYSTPSWIFYTTPKFFLKFNWHVPNYTGRRSALGYHRKPQDRGEALFPIFIFSFTFKFDIYILFTMFLIELQT